MTQDHIDKTAVKIVTNCPDKSSGKRIANRSDLRAMGIWLSNSSLLRLELRGNFPRRIRIGGTSVCWLVSEVESWLDERAKEREHHHYADYS